MNRPGFSGTKAARRKLNVVKTVGRSVDVWRKTEGEGGAGKGRKGQGHAGRGFSYRMPPITRDQMRGHGSFLLLCSVQGKVCYNQNYDYCLFVADSTARYSTVHLSYSKFTTWFFQPKISRYLSPVTELSLLRSLAF